MIWPTDSGTRDPFLKGPFWKIALPLANKFYDTKLGRLSGQVTSNMSSDFNASFCQPLQGAKIDRIWISETAVYSFDALTYLYFVLAFLLFPYAVYRVVACKFNWEVNTKTLARHWSDVMLGLSYGCIVFVFGNYAKAFRFVSVM
jgi:hypothetical protein